MKTFKNFIKEGLSAQLFHRTGIEKALSMLTSEVFRFSKITDTDETGWNDKELKKYNLNKKYFMSFGRSLGSSFVQSGLHDESVFDHAVIEFDGKVLAQHYKGSPIAEPEFNRRAKGRSEEEDRILSNKPYGPIPKGAIKHIYLYPGTPPPPWEPRFKNRAGKPVTRFDKYCSEIEEIIGPENVTVLSVKGPGRPKTRHGLRRRR